MRNAEGFGQGAGVQASGAAESDQGEVARVVSPLDGDYADGFLHDCVDYANDTGCEFIEREWASLMLEPFCGDAAGAIEIESEIAAEEAGGLQASEDEIRIGDGGLGAASVADGAGIGSGGFGADAKNAAGIEARERTSTGADGVNVEHGDADGKAGDLRVAGGGDRTFDQRDVGGGASHVEGDDASEAAAARGDGGADNASGGAGENGADRFAGGRGKRGDASAGLHDEDARVPHALRSLRG